MKILHIPNYYSPHVGGIEQVCFDIVESLKDQDVNYSVSPLSKDAVFSETQRLRPSTKCLFSQGDRHFAIEL